MSILSSLVSACLVVLMLLGLFVVIYSLVKLAHSGQGTNNSNSNISIPLLGGKTIEIKGPAWLIVTAIGSLMIGSPVLAAFAQKSSDVTIPPDTVQRVQESERLPDENLESFQYIRDLSILDLRESQRTSWASFTRAIFSKEERKKIKPAVLRNIMTLRKSKPANSLILTYSTSGTLVVRCISHHAIYQEKVSTRENKTTDLWAVTVDVSAMPLDTDFDVIVEATYYNGFSDSAGSDFTTYANKQKSNEDVSLAILFPDTKPMKSISIMEFPPTGGDGVRLTAAAREYRDPSGLSYYWTTTNTRSDYYYKFSWTW